MAVTANKLNSKKTAVALGLLFALMHAFYTLFLVLTNGALNQVILALHFTNMSSMVLPFNLATWITGMILAFVLGAIIGTVFAWLYNNLKLK